MDRSMHTTHLFTLRWFTYCTLLLVALQACQTPSKSDTQVTQADSSRPESMDTTASVAKPYKLQPQAVKFLWREDRPMDGYDVTVSTIVLDDAYVASISDPEKAALGYVATFIGNECAWDGKAAPDRSNLKCKILTALDLGYQCSDTHLGFLRHWFRGDSTTLQKLESCPTIPDGSTIQETFDKIDVAVDDNEIIVTYTVVSINTRQGKTWTWDVKDHFQLHDNGLALVETERSEPTAADFNVSI